MERKSHKPRYSTDMARMTHKGQNVMDLTDDQAREHLEKLLWPDGKPVCPHCGSVDAYKMTGATCRKGLCRCRDCKKQFTVTVGTIFEDSHIGPARWVRAFHLMCSSKKGISALQLQRNLGIGSYRTAWYMAHRIRMAMKCEPMAGLLKGKVEVDETYIGGKSKNRHGQEWRPKVAVVALVSRKGQAVAPVVKDTSARTLQEVIREHVDKKATIYTDGHGSYIGVGQHFKGGHQSVNHAEGEYVRGNNIHTNNAEGFFALLKRGVYGTFHHVSERHLDRYCDEFSFRWGVRALKDADRLPVAIRDVVGKRLFYKSPVGATLTEPKPADPWTMPS